MLMCEIMSLKLWRIIHNIIQYLQIKVFVPITIIIILYEINFFFSHMLVTSDASLDLFSLNNTLTSLIYQTEVLDYQLSEVREVISSAHNTTGCDVTCQAIDTSDLFLELDLYQVMLTS